METTLTIPKNRITHSLAVAGFSTLSGVGPSCDTLSRLLDAGVHFTGSNVAWLESALPRLGLSKAEDLYILSIQRLTSVTTHVQAAEVARSDRDSILEIKDVLSLTGIELAKAMGVSRTAVYQWIEESKTMRPKSRKRLEILKGLTDQWSEKVGIPISRSPWVSGAQRARLAEMLTANTENSLDDAEAFLEKLAALKPETKSGHRSIVEIARERNWKELPEHVRQAQWNSRRPSAGTTPDRS